ncbi:trypsin-like serine peptidase [Paracoccus actinidiae]|uniref:trypsin-like serine peptidase n=1 Tax=Paracoccus actinidiae TaxID=3064531 RepID=UPI0027D2B276|nr:trypsin-like peptidase domain-containing protein [Paracoccus sp. M09]
MSNKQHSVWFLVALAVGPACAETPEFNSRPALPFPDGLSLESQCGLVDDLQHVEFYDGSLGIAENYVAQHEKTTVQLQWLTEPEIAAKLPDHAPGNVAGERWCTATLVNPTTLLTAGHCFDIGQGEVGWVTPFRFSSNGLPEFAEPEVLAMLFVANFGYQLSVQDGAMRDPDVFPVVALKEYRLGGLDYAIVEIGEDNEGRLPSELNHPVGKTDVRDVSATELLALIQHPQGDPKKIEAGSARETVGSSIFYDNIDTHGGSSGSGVRDADGDVVAVHTNGGCSPSGGGANRGVLMKSIASVSSHF